MSRAEVGPSLNQASSCVATDTASVAGHDAGRRAERSTSDIARTSYSAHRLSGLILVLSTRL